MPPLKTYTFELGYVTYLNFSEANDEYKFIINW